MTDYLQHTGSGAVVKVAVHNACIDPKRGTVHSYNSFISNQGKVLLYKLYAVATKEQYEEYLLNHV